MPEALNPEQQTAVARTDGPLLVLAGAGAGKTRTIAAKIAHLVQRRGIDPARILALTFTQRAARGMRERVAAVLGEPARRVRLGTFHAFGLAVIAEHPACCGRRPQPSVLDAEDARALLAELAGAGGEALAAEVARLKQRAVLPEEALAAAASPAERRAARLLRRYDDRLRQLNAVDFEDLILLPLAACRRDPAFRQRLARRFDHVLVDEYQDTNIAQYLLFRELVGDGTPFTVVGDDDQSIYAWRGAHPENLRQLVADFPALEVVRLERNYRSTGAILEAANALIAHNGHLFEKRLRSEAGPGEPPALWSCGDPEEEAERVALDIARLVALEGRRPQDFAVLYRGNHQARPVEEALRAAGLPYRLSGGIAFFERREIRDLLAYLRLIVNGDDDVAFLRAAATPRRALGETAIEALTAAAGEEGGLLAAAEQLVASADGRRFPTLAAWLERLGVWRAASSKLPLAALARRVLAESGLREAIAAERDRERARRRLARLEQFLAFLERRGLAGPSGLAELALIARDEGEDEERAAISLSTIHAAKGLEFEVVYVIGLEEGILPHEQALAAGALEEERRLLYVAMTRARSRLVLSRALARRSRGGRVPSAPSRFLAELPPALFAPRAEDPERAARNAAWHLQHIRAMLAAEAADGR